jgi:hypothetical protein
MSHSGNSAADDSGSEPDKIKYKGQVPYPPMLAYWDKNQVCRYVNTAGLDWFSQKADVVIGKMHMLDYIGPELYNENLPHIRSALSGHPQVFERILKKEGKGEMAALVTMIPDIHQEETAGFYVHVADVGQFKRKNEKKLADRKELLKAIIDIQEKERLSIAEMLRDNVNQLLVYVNLMLQGTATGEKKGDFSAEMMHAIQQAILELNKLSNHLYPSGLSLLGLLPSIENLLTNYRQEAITDISFYCNDSAIEEISQHDKLSVYRIIQEFTALVVDKRKSSYIQIELNYRDYCLMIRFVYNGLGIVIDHTSDEFRDIRSRIDYYSGKIKEFRQDDEAVFITHLVFHHSQ